MTKLVVDSCDAGNASDPTFIDVIVRDLEKPTAVLQLVDPNGRPINPAEVAFGQAFVLSAARSSDIAPGKVVEFQFTLVS